MIDDTLHCTNNSHISAGMSKSSNKCDVPIIVVGTKWDAIPVTSLPPSTAIAVAAAALQTFATAALPPTRAAITLSELSASVT
jgi:hypothetical protein